MKKILTVTLAAVALTACAGKYDINKDKEEHERWVLERHMEKQSMNRSFCDGSGFKFYTENSHAYSFGCKEGGYHFLKKE